MTRGCFSPEMIGLGLALLAGCSKTRGEPASTPPVSAVEVPAVPPGAERAQADGQPRERLKPHRDATQDESLEIEVSDDGGSVRISSSDGGIRFWGRFTNLDGGFSFQGGFSTGTSVGAGRDGGTAP